jgi:Mg/Co/Ni transporter MgtE
MKARSKLTLAFLQYDPASAARVLQELDLAILAGFLDTVPARLAAPVLNNMIPFAAARCLARLAPHRSAAILRQLAPHDRTSLARLLTVEARTAILEELPEKIKTRIVSALRYPVDSVGAWIDPRVPVLRTDNDVGDALKFLVDSPAIGHIFLASAEQGLFVGAVALVTLVASARNVRLGDLAIVRVEPLSNRATLASVQQNVGWDDFLMLPVTGRRGTVLGALSRQALRAGLHQRHKRVSAHHKPMVVELSNALLASGAGLARLVMPAQNSNSPELPPGDDRVDAR